MRILKALILTNGILFNCFAVFSSDYCDNFLTKILSIQSVVEIKLDNPGRPLGIDSTSFSIEKYFEAFDKLKIKNGYRLDFFYYKSLYSGSPIFLILQDDEDLDLLISPFVRIDTFPVLNNEKYTFTSYSNEIFDELSNRRDFSNYIKAESSKEGFFQLLTFHLIGQAFGLWWHDRYNLYWIICSKQKLEQLFSLEIPEVRLTNEQIEKAWTIELTPKISLSDDYCQIEITTFAPWKGFIRKDFKINRTFPHNITLLEERILLEYSCEIDY